jgi:integrase
MPRRSKAWLRHFGPDEPGRQDPLLRKVDQLRLSLPFPPYDKDQWVRDDRIPGFGAKLSKNGKPSFVYDCRIAGKSKRLTFEQGRSFDVVEARKWARAIALKLELGVDPRPVPTSYEQKTLRRVVHDYLAFRGPDYKSRREFERSMENHVLPTLGEYVYEAITRRDLAALRDSIVAKAGKHAAHTALKNLSVVWNAYYSDHASDSYTAWPQVKSPLTKKDRASKGRNLSDYEIAEVWRATFKLPPNKGAWVRFLFLSGMRRGGGADDGGASRIIRANVAPDWTWVFYPGSGQESTKPPYLIPLSGPAQDLLREHFPEGAQWAFAPLGPFAPLKRELDSHLKGVAAWTWHDIRHTCRTLLSRCASRDIAELCVGHTLKGMQKVYDHHQYEAEKLRAFEALATLLADLTK